MRGRGILGLLFSGAMAVAFVPEATNGQEATAEQEPLFVNYGTGASIRQGDNDHHQAIYLSVPAGTTGPLYVRVFDPDTFNFHDQMDKRTATTRTRFTVFGGDGAFIPEPTDPEALTEAELTAGTKLAEETYGRDRRTDNQLGDARRGRPRAGPAGRRPHRLPPRGRRALGAERQRLRRRALDARGRRTSRPTGSRCSPIPRPSACRGAAC